ncbi:peptidylprolyl isomerase [Pacificibacter sp. AS14]|uniref:peptidylprolyl isomerase n=1 Tax=Pacificibacter sp. AS14 TaxID=3135785 RepID=UPI00317E08D3
MKYHTNVIAAAIFGALTLTSGAFAQDMSSDTVVATVNGSQITLGHVIAARGSLPAQYQELEDAQLFEGILNQMIQQELLKQSAGDLSKAVAIQIENEQRIAIAGSALQEIATSAVTDEALKAAYDAKYADFAPGREFNAAHILVETEEEAKAIVAELEGGADFSQLAMDKSTGPSGPNGGDLGWFGLGMMVAPFEQAVVEMEPGDISAPVQTQFGWHVIKLVDSRLQDVPALETERDELAATIEDEAIRARLDELQAAATLEIAEGIDPALMRDDALLND